jgi:hypothetical protein
VSPLTKSDSTICARKMDKDASKIKASSVNGYIAFGRERKEDEDGFAEEFDASVLSPSSRALDGILVADVQELVKAKSSGAKCRKEYVKVLRVLNAGHRFDDMVMVVKLLINHVIAFANIEKRVSDLNIEERELMSLAFRGAMRQRRASLSSLGDLKRNLVSFPVPTASPSSGLTAASASEKEKVKDPSASIVEFVFDRVVAQMKSIIQDVELICEDQVDRHGSENITCVFYYTLIGDFNRYYGDFDPKSLRGKQALNKSKEAYMRATKICQDNGVSPADPAYLTLVLNHTLLMREYLNDKQGALELAEEAFNDALGALGRASDTLDETERLCKLIKMNVVQWKSADTK